MTITRDFAPATTRPTERASTLLGTVTVVVVVSSLAVGALTAYGQGMVDGSLYPLVNSAGPWVLVAFALAVLTRTQAGAVLAGVAALSLMEIGFVAAAQARGYTSGTSSVEFWLIAAVLAGPAVGLAGHWLRRGDVIAAALGAGLITGVLVGEAVHIHTDLLATWYPKAELVTAAVLFVSLAAWRFPRPGPVGLALASSVPAAVLVLTFLRLA